MGRPRSSRDYQHLRNWVLRTYDLCCVCGKPVDKSLSGRHRWGPTLEHTQELVEGGSELDPANAKLAHLRCNSLKEAKRRERRKAEAEAPRSSRRW